MRLSRIIAAVTELLVGVNVRLGEPALDDASIPMPKVVFIPTTDDFAPVRAPGRDPTPVATRQAGLEVHLWQRDLDTCEQLLNDVIAAVHSLASGSFAIRGGSWKKEELAHDGRAYVLDLVFDIPITLAPPTTVVVQSVDADTGLAP